MPGPYGLIGNGTTVGIISPRGSLDWLCAPDLDFPSHFSSLLDERSGGRFSIRPSGPFESSQAYLGREGRSAVLETRFSTASGRGRVVDWMPWQTSPVVMRQVETLEGSIPWELFCLPRFQYGQISANPQLTARGICFRPPGLSEHGRLNGTQEIRLDSMLGAGVSRFVLSTGELRRFSWSWGRNGMRSDELLDQDFSACIQEWEDWLHRCPEFVEDSSCCPADPAWRAMTLRSEIVLRLLTHSGTGAVIESPTTSIPCVEHGTQNWDHRYSWLRHIPDTLLAWIQLGHEPEARRLWCWVADLVMGTPAQELLPAYGLDGSLVPDEHELHALRGHEGARPVRVGNVSARQFQLDSLASVILSFEAASSIAPLSPESPLWKKLEEITQLAAQLWRRPDHGIWDLRFRPEHYLASKVSCWRGLEAAIRLLRQSGRAVPQRWPEESRKLRETILREGFRHDRQVYTQAFGEDELDSSALLVGLSGLRDWTDPDMLSTLILLEAELREGPLLRRNKSSHASPDFEGAHLLSTLWWCNSLADAGRTEEAAEVLHELVGLSDPLGFFGEGIDTATGRAIGNFPSMRVHGVAISTFRKVARASARLRAPRRAA